MKRGIIFCFAFFLLGFSVIATSPAEPPGPDDYRFIVGLSRNIEGQNVKLVRIGSENSVILEVNNQAETIHNSKFIGCLYFQIKEINRNSVYLDQGEVVMNIVAEDCMVWKDAKGNIIRKEPYFRNTDACLGYRCFNDDEVGPECYDLKQCKDSCSRECVKIKEEPILTIENNIFEFLDKLVRDGTRHTIVVGDSAPSTDIISANKIFLKLQDYSNLKADSTVELTSRATDRYKLILIGHPCDNNFIKSLSCDNWPYKKGEAVIKLGNEGLIVAGSTKEGTLKAAEIVANYRDNFDKLRSKNELIVTYEVTPDQVIPVKDEKRDSFVCGDGICNLEEDCEIDCKSEISCVNGCSDRENNCLPIGFRIESMFCDKDLALKSQKGKEASCYNNHECSSNLCIDNQCIEPGLFQKILDWFRRLFS